MGVALKSKKKRRKGRKESRLAGWKPRENLQSESKGRLLIEMSFLSKFVPFVKVLK